MALTSTLNTIKLKQGDTLRWLCTFDINNVIQDLTGMVVRASLKYGSSAPIPLTVTIQNQSINRGQFEVYANTSLTSSFPVGMMSCDFEYIASNGDKISSETFNVQVLRQITV